MRVYLFTILVAVLIGFMLGVLSVCVMEGDRLDYPKEETTK